MVTRVFLAQYNLVLLFFVLTTDAALKLPSYLQPCSRNDPALDECSLSHARKVFHEELMEKGNPLYDTPALDPMTLGELNIEDGHLLLKLHQVKMHGLRNADPRSVRFDLRRRHNEFQVWIPEMVVTSNYSVWGKSSSIGVAGDGECTLTLKNVTASISNDFELEIKEDGKEYMAIKNTALISHPEHMAISMSGLFHGHTIIGDAVVAALNDNWHEVYKEFSPSFDRTLARVVEQAFNGLTSAVPYDEIFPIQI